MDIKERISKELGLAGNQVAAVMALLGQGATIPFIARYRKEKTGSLDEVAVTEIRDWVRALEELGTRKKAILKSLEERDLLTPELDRAVAGAGTMAELEDLYERYRPKKRTRAMAAREKGLAPLAEFLLAQGRGNPDAEAQSYIDPAKGVETGDDALAGARDIIAEAVNENPAVRAGVRNLFQKTAQIRSSVKKGKDEAGSKYTDYFDWSEPAFKAPSHRILAMLRGSGEAVLTVHVLPDEDQALALMGRMIFKPHPSPCRDQVKTAVRDAYKRLLSKSLEKECLTALKEAADLAAIQVFVRNLKELLLAPPLGEKRILAIDPGFRTGCKTVCLDAGGRLLHHDVIHPHGKDTTRAARTVRDLVRQYRIEAVAVGNGTAGRETQAFVEGLDLGLDLVLTDESGASVYSASEIAREEFPDHDITVRGAVSIGRRLMDPLAELVKIDPRSIGVGQYQHDVNQKQLHEALDETVRICVNQVGVEANTASRELLARVSGLNTTIASNMVEYRNQNGPFRSRREFLKVPRLGPKAYEQAAGFLRIRNGDNPLDRSGIHPESYGVVEKMAKDLKCRPAELVGNKGLADRIRPAAYVTDTVGMPTLTDILAELAAPGRDPREPFQTFSFDPSIREISDLVPGMRVPGIVTNVTAFGAFVDIGVHQDGLVHISRMADRFVKDPNEIVTVRQQVNVRILDVDVKRKRISLSLKD